MTLQKLRNRLTALDRELIELVADRQRIIAEIGALKIKTAVPTRDYERERQVMEGAREQASGLGLDPDLAEDIMALLIRSSLTHQEQTRVAAQGSGTGQRALVIGGSGQMGAWIAQFLSSQGYRVEIADPVPSESPFPQKADWRDCELDDELIFVATPIRITADVLAELAERRPRGTVIDIGSLKTPLRAGLEALVAAGCSVTSIHPMFGPNTRLLSGKHVIFVDVGVPEATARAKGLFEATMAERIEMSLEDHDRLIAYVLGLSHAINLAFFTALASSGELVPRLKTLSSTTFDAQLAVASLVAKDNPRLYFEIQALNDYGSASLEALKAAVDRVIGLVRSNDETGFVALMNAGRQYLESRG